MADPISTVKNALDLDLETFISETLVGYVANEGGTMKSNLSWSIEETPYNTYSYQPKARETVPGYRKKDGTYVDSYQRQAPPIKVPIEENEAGLNAAIERGIGTFVSNLQSRV